MKSVLDKVSMIKPLHVLIVEDSLEDTSFLLEELRRGGFSTEYERVETAAALKHALVQREWDVIISDYTLPTMSGLEVPKVLRETNKEIPFIIVSGMSGEDIAIESLKAGAKDYLTKGTLARLSATIELELKETEARRQESGIQKQLQENQDWLQAIFEASRDGILVEEEEKIVYVNPAYLKLLGYDCAEELMGKHLALVIAPEDIKRMLEYGKPRVKGEPAPPVYEFRARRRDKTLIDLEGSISTARAGNHFCIVSILREISERKKAEQALRE